MPTMDQWAAQFADRLAAIRNAVLVIEDELREQASGSQDGYLLDVANRLRKIIEENRN